MNPYQIKGQYNFFLDIQIKGQSPFQSSILTVNAFSRNDRKIAIAIKCKWFRVRAGRKYQLLGIHSNTYQMSAQDVASTIEIEVHSQEDDYEGVAFVTYGPIVLESTLKLTLEGLLSAGGSKFSVSLVQENSKIIKDCSLMITSDSIRIVSNNANDKSLKIRYNLDSPEIEMNYLDTKKLAFILRNENDIDQVQSLLGARCSQLTLEFPSKNSRDLVFLSLKCFAAKSYLNDSHILSTLDQIFEKGDIFSKRQSNGMNLGDFLLEVDGLKRELALLIRMNDVLHAEKETYSKEINSLEQELTDTITAYTQTIAELKTGLPNESVLVNEISMLGPKRIDEQNELKKLRLENKGLQIKLERVTEELEIIRHFEKNDGFFTESKIWEKNPEKTTLDKVNRTEKNSFFGEPSWLKQSVNPYEIKMKEMEHALLRQKQAIDELRGRNTELEGKLKEQKVNGSMMEMSRIEVDRKKYEDFERENKTLKSLCESLRNELKTKTGDVKAYLKDDAYELKAINMKLMNEIETLKNQKSELSRMTQAFNLQNNGNEAIAELQALIAESSKSNERLILDLSNSRKEVQTLKNQVEVSKRSQPSQNLNETSILNKSVFFEIECENQNLKSKYASLEMMLNDYKNKFNMLQQELEKKDQREKILVFEKQNLIAKIEKQNAEAKGDKSIIEFLNTSKVNLGKSSYNNNNVSLLGDIDSESIGLKNKIASLEGIILEYKIKFNDAQNELFILKEENNLLKSERIRSNQPTKEEPNLNNASFSLNRTMQVELETENENLRKNVVSLESMISEYKNKMTLVFQENIGLKDQLTEAKQTKENYLLSKNEVNRLEQERSKLQAKFNDLQAKRNETSFVPEEEKVKINKLEQENKNLHIKLNQLQNELVLLKEENLELKSQKIKSNEYLNRSAQKDQNNSSFYLNKTLQAELETENENLRKNMNSLEMMLSESKSRSDQLYQEISSLKMRIQELEKKTNDNNERSSIAGNLENENKFLVNKLKDLQNNFCYLEEENNQLKAIQINNEPEKVKRAALILNNSSFNLNRTAQAELETENENLRKNLFSLETLVTEYKNKLTLLFQENNSLKEQTNEQNRLNESFSRIKSDSNEWKAENLKLIEKIKNLEEERTVLSARINASQAQLQKSSEEISSLRNASKANSSFLAQKDLEKEEFIKKIDLGAKTISELDKKLNHSIEERANLLKESGKHLDLLQKENNMLKNEVLQLKVENNSLKKDIDNLNEHLEYAKNSSFISSMKEGSSKLETENMKLNLKINDLQKEIIQLKEDKIQIKFEKNNELLNRSQNINTSFIMNKTLQSDLEAENENLRKTLLGLQTTITELEVKLKNASQENSTLNKKIIENNQKFNDLTSDNKKLAVLFESEKKNIEFENKNNSNAFNREINDLKGKSLNLEQERNQLKKIIENNKKEYSSLIEEITQLRKVIEKHKNDNYLLTEEISQLKQTMERTNKSKIMMENSINKNDSSFYSLNRSFQIELETENESLKKNMSGMEAIVADCKTKINTLFAENSELRKQISDNENLIKGFKNQNKDNFNSVLREKNSEKEILSFENLKKTNEKLLEENFRLMSELRKTDESRMKSSMMSENKEDLRERIADLERENEMLSNEKDRLIVEMSKLIA